jgi:hypothetical protein
LFFLEVDTIKEGIEEGTGSGSAIFSSYDHDCPGAMGHLWGMGFKNIRLEHFIGGICLFVCLFVTMRPAGTRVFANYVCTV